jgi:hypothetical protein
MKFRYIAIAVIIVLMVIPVVLLALTPTSVLKLSVELPPMGFEYQVGPVTLVLSTTADIMTLSQFFELNPLVGQVIIVVLVAGLILFAAAVIQTWNVASLVAKGELWEDWRFIALAVAALLYAGYITLVCYVWGSIYHNFAIFNSPIFLVPVIASLVMTPTLITVSFYRFRKKAEEFVKSME